MRIEVLTADIRGAGTSSGVQLALQGPLGTWGPVPLGNLPSHFQRGACDEMTLQVHTPGDGNVPVSRLYLPRWVFSGLNAPKVGLQTQHRP